MGEHTKIEWAHASWNPWRGCKKVSAGCKNCYAERDSIRFGQNFSNVVRSKTTFRDPLKWQKSETLKHGSRIFTCSISDFFIEEADLWREEAWQIIKQTPYTYLILTKRPERIPEHLPEDWDNGYNNVWLGTSAENQEYADERIPVLLRVPAKLHFISAEPLLGHINLRFPDNPNPNQDVWVICGGESGSNAREMKLEWARSLRDQCKSVNVPFFMKQDFGMFSGMRGRIEDDLWIKEFPQTKG